MDDGCVLGTFLDIEGAFDNVSLKMSHYQIIQIFPINNPPVDKPTAGWIVNMAKKNVTSL